MKIWVDAQLPPGIAPWISKKFGVEACALRDIGLRDATDRQIFAAAQQGQTVIMTKDSDFVALVTRHGTPPQVIWLTCGNTSHERLKQILSATLPQAIDLLKAGEPLVEIV